MPLDTSPRPHQSCVQLNSTTRQDTECSRQPGKQDNTAKDLIGKTRIKCSVDTEPQPPSFVHESSATRLQPPCWCSRQAAQGESIRLVTVVRPQAHSLSLQDIRRIKRACYRLSHSKTCFAFTWEGQQDESSQKISDACVSLNLALSGKPVSTWVSSVNRAVPLNMKYWASYFYLSVTHTQHVYTLAHQNWNDTKENSQI